MTLLSLNLNKIATLRNSRGGHQPHLEQVALDLLNWGAKGITVHPRPDERHITKKDVYALKTLIQNFNKKNKASVEFNIEGYPSESFLNLIAEVHPDQATLVPDPPEALTSNAGWDLEREQSMLSQVTQKVSKQGIRTSLFVDPHEFTSSQQSALKTIKPHRVELYTESYAQHYNTPKQDSVTAVYAKTAQILASLDIEVNAGHDLNLKNLAHLVKTIPLIKEVSIGHAFICESLYLGLQQTLREYHKILNS